MLKITAITLVAAGSLFASMPLHEGNAFPTGKIKELVPRAEARRGVLPQVKCPHQCPICRMIEAARRNSLRSAIKEMRLQACKQILKFVFAMALETWETMSHEEKRDMVTKFMNAVPSEIKGEMLTEIQKMMFQKMMKPSDSKPKIEPRKEKKKVRKAV